MCFIISRLTQTSPQPSPTSIPLRVLSPKEKEKGKEFLRGSKRGNREALVY